MADAQQVTAAASIDWQSAFNVCALIVGAIGGGLIRVLWDTHKETCNELKKLKDALPETYVRKDDLKVMVDGLKDMIDALFKKLDRIDEKLDKKADKP